ncbi:glycosyl hydrolase [Plantactinospora sp. KLBMP9567]|uniref:glycosyl hydrolase n=1 Tax=Plantactinospora sp. KLBMP9567 TaxID=3085900 RepID=UPI00298162C6|nr:glycosyl hydrolase [Plantactinospora sp. KLBMP9567]MDW5330751.1 glycosyl hydrolase [Plantactinospora sp. KLBMP9567]
MRLVRSRRHRAVVYLLAVTVAATSLVVTGSTATAHPDVASSTRPVAVPLLTRDSFADPPTSVRPKYRWWMPLAYTDDQQLAAELAQMKQAGAGGAEVAPFLSEGPGYRTNPFLSTYGWGTPLWTEKVETMLSAARDTGLNLDFSIGPRWPATVPTVADVNHPAAAQKIVFSHEFGAGGTRRTGALPTNFDTAPPAGANRTLIAALVAKCVDPQCASQPSPRLLDQASVTDVTAQVAADGTLDMVFPGDAESTYALIAFYQTPNGGNLNGYTATVTNYALDTLSPAGAQAVIDFYEDNILTPDVQALLEQLATTELFEDSLELGAQKWTSNLVAEWTRRRGYSPVSLLPALAGAGAQGGLPGRFPGQPYFDFADGVGDRVRTDYRQTLSDLYIAYRLDVLREWTREHHMKTRAQPYGEAIDAAEAASHIDVPEGESLAFGRNDSAHSNVQNYKVVAAGAHLSGAPVVSDECCAFRGKVWGSTVGDASDTSNLQAVYRGYAGGVNQLVWHGFPYLSRGPAGSAAQSIWPGMSYGGNASYSEAFGAKGGPNWADYRQVNDHLARMQLVLRQGKPRFDLAVYWQDFGIGLTGTSANKLIPDSSAMASAGYTYEYVSPAHLRDPDATVRHGTLFPNASAYRALLLNNQTTLPLDTARTILRMARQGLPVVILGELPSSTPGYQPDQDPQLRAVIAELLRQGGVVRVDSEAAVPGALQRAGIRAAAAHVRPSDAILDVRRHGAGVDYYYLFNQSASTTYQNLTLTGDGVPYRLDTWTGGITPIPGYRKGRGTVTLPVRLAGHDAMVIAVTARRDTTFPGPAIRDSVASGTGPGGLAPQPVRLTDWSLTVDSWTPGPSGLPGDTAHTTIGPVAVPANPDRTLPAWSQLDDDLADVSGVGTYTTRFRLGPDWTRVRGAHLDLGTVVDTVRVNVNGRDLPPVNPMDLGRVDVSAHLRPGDNTITVRVASTLRNAVRVAPGTGAASQPRMDYGLLGPVSIRPYAATAAVLTVEPTQRMLPLAAGGYTEAGMLVTNASNQPVRVNVDATGPIGITATGPPAIVVPAGGSAIIPAAVRNSGPDSGTSVLTVTARASNGLTATTQQWLSHSNNLALNTEGARYPRLIAETGQDRFPAELAVDGQPGTYYSSWGKSAGQGPTADNPAMFGFDFGAPVSISSVTVGGQSDFGVRTFTIEASNDSRSWRTVATVPGHPSAGGTVSFAAITARYLRLRITDTWDPVRPTRNVQISEVAARA